MDVRSVDEFTGKIIAPPGMTETAQRAGHIPGAANIPWAQAANEDGTFKSAEELKQLYDAKGINGNGEVIAYCRIGERSSHTWFVAEVSARLQRREELRRLVDRVGQSGWRAHRESDGGAGGGGGLPGVSRECERAKGTESRRVPGA